MKLNFGYLFLLLLSTSTLVCAWDSEELEIFDLVEEVNKNFYEVLNVEQNAATQEIKRAFRYIFNTTHF